MNVTIIQIQTMYCLDQLVIVHYHTIECVRGWYCYSQDLKSSINGIRISNIISMSSIKIIININVNINMNSNTNTNININVNSSSRCYNDIAVML